MRTREKKQDSQVELGASVLSAIEVVVQRYKIWQFLDFYLLELSQAGIDARKEVVQWLGIAPETLREWLKGNGSPSPEQLLMIDTKSGLPFARVYLTSLLKGVQDHGSQIDE